MANKPLELKKIFTITILHERGHGLRSIMRQAGASDTAVRKYRNLYDEAKEALG